MRVNRYPLYTNDAGSCALSVLPQYRHFSVFYIGQYLLPFAKALWFQCVSRELSSVDDAANLNCERSPGILPHVDDRGGLKSEKRDYKEVHDNVT